MWQFLLSTLIAVFLTPQGIVVGADTAGHLPDGRTLMRQKIRVCGSQMVAGLYGNTAILSPQPNGSVAMFDPQQIIEERCKSVQVGQSMQMVAMEVARALAQDATERRLPERPGVEPSGFLQGLILAGYEGDQAVAYIAQIGIDATATDFSVREFQRVRIQCFVLAAETAAANALRNGDGRIPRAVRERPEVAAIRAASKSVPPCSQLSRADAEGFFGLAVDVSHDFAAEFDIRPGRVNWPIDLTLVRPNGTEPVRRKEK
jgi:hypothetical protein